MEPIVQPRSHAKDVFLNLVATVALYTSVGSLFHLLFSVIDRAYSINRYGYYSSSISLSVAILIIVFPLFISFMWLIRKESGSFAETQMSGIRKWLNYITLFISGGFIVGDLVTIVYKFIDGQDLTAGFLYKALSIIIVASVVFGYYIADVRNKITPRLARLATVISLGIIIISISTGFYVIGSPKTQRLMKYDQNKLNDLQMISTSIKYFSDEHKRLPKDLTELRSDSSMSFRSTDFQTNELYEYSIIDQTSYSLCAVFNLDSSETNQYSRYSYYGYGYEDEVWSMYKKGTYCFKQKIIPKPVSNNTKYSPTAYPDPATQYEINYME